MNPALILADDSTSNLDTKSANAVFEMMRRVNATNGTTFLVVTHDMDLARRCHRAFELVVGRVASATLAV
jgi:lipoprotein-releasing system ATP-binding protein